MDGDLEPATGPEDDADDHGSVARPEEVVVPIDALGALIEEASRLRLPKVTIRLRRAFYVDEALIRRLDALVTNRFGVVDRITSVDCRCDVRYADVSGESYRSLDECLEDAGTSADPERLEIHWSALTNQGFYYAVDYSAVGCSFTTEQPLASDPEAGPSPESAQMFIGAISANKQWARDVVRDARGHSLREVFGRPN